jgi:asparagine N-glycosylation enzyme membrane subunit Stt3
MTEEAIASTAGGLKAERRKGTAGFFAYPALIVELCAILYLPWHLLDGSVTPAFSRHPSLFFLIARCVSVAAGTLTVLLVIVIGRRVSSAWAGILAAALFAVSPLAVRDAHFAVADTLLVFLLFSFLAWPLRRDGESRGIRRLDVTAAGILFGLACSTNYTALLLAPALSVRLALDGSRALRGFISDVGRAACSAVPSSCC